MNVYEQIEAIFSGASEESPIWAQELLDEIRSVKKLLIDLKKESESKNIIRKHASESQKQRDFYAFVKKFRDSMQAREVGGTSPSFEYYGSLLGVDKHGLLYDKNSFRKLSRQEAFEVYKYVYKYQKEYKISG